ncbi:U3 small nucleolar RNA-associated protein 11 [Penicillium canariense]|uniref:U3 small nucleolar RNA-associated protein 11 n=1 Tax=Penicillium canariense TaxID=189055 RepID=A0A9W9I550_9EURO|nr:U3 small nucleolar RNA-associated protein 11 [Penicillium canariense]KAJ5167221.1 U3 small nucleolar RNA-associated protein 11 [Penicillium canariense]
MSSMRNAVQRRQHRERGQLEGREKWGLLEKHKDYSLRAKDYNEKKAKLKRLQEKAKDRNADEFNFGMVGAKNGQQGKHGRGVGVSRDSAAARGLSHDAIKLLKTQDQNYLRTVGERIRREIERLERDTQLQKEMNEALGGKGGKKKQEENGDDEDEDAFDGFDDFDDLDVGAAEKQKSRKVVFADDRGDQQNLKRRREDDDAMDEDEDEDEKPSAPGKTPKQLAAEKEALREARRARKIRKRATEGRENKLAALRRQYAEIQKAEREVELQRGKMDRSVGGTNKHGLKWKIRERKR